MCDSSGAKTMPAHVCSAAQRFRSTWRHVVQLSKGPRVAEQRHGLHPVPRGATQCDVVHAAQRHVLQRSATCCHAAPGDAPPSTRARRTATLSAAGARAALARAYRHTALSRCRGADAPSAVPTQMWVAPSPAFAVVQSVLVQIWQGAPRLQMWRAANPVLVQMWVAPSLFQSWCRCGRMGPVPAQTWETANPVPVPMWRRHGDAAYELRHVVEHVSGVVRLRSAGTRWHAPASPRCAAECVQAGARRMKQRGAPTGCRSARARGEGECRVGPARGAYAQARACACVRTVRRNSRSCVFVAAATSAVDEPICPG
jgi:hypothetical protein